MTQEEKQLLTKDLCERLLYGVFVHTWYNKPLDIKYTGIDLYTNTVNLDIPNDDNAKVYIDNCKPYLRPMSSMTDTERADWLYYCGAEYDCEFHTEPTVNTDKAHLSTDWLNEHHFDYRGLIEKGLALEAPDGMYK